MLPAPAFSRWAVPEGLIACTDADTVVAPDWLAAQLRAVSEGARAIGGRIELADDGSLPGHVLRRHAEEGRRRHEHLLSDPTGEAQHWQFSGASMALTAAAYAQVGGLEPLTALEDEQLEEGSAPPRRADPPPAIRQGDDIAPSGGESHPRLLARPRQNGGQPS